MPKKPENAPNLEEAVELLAYLQGLRETIGGDEGDDFAKHEWYRYLLEEELDTLFIEHPELYIRLSTIGGTDLANDEALSADEYMGTGLPDQALRGASIEEIENQSGPNKLIRLLKKIEVLVSGTR